MPELEGELIPLVMIPRYTTYTGADTFVTAPLEVSAYDTAILSFWTSDLAGDDTTCEAALEESHDAYSWDQIGSPLAGDHPAVVNTRDLTKRWMRMRITLTAGNTDAFVAISCWAVGSLQKRLP